MSVSEIVQRLERLEEHCKIEATKVARLWRMHEGVMALQMPHVVPPSPATPAPAAPAAVKIERVVLEVKYRWGTPPTTWNWNRLINSPSVTLQPGESVRVVEEVAPAVHRGSGVFDANGDEVPWEGVVAALKDERDAAIRERDAALEEAEKATALAKGLEEKRAYFRQGRDDARVECERLNARVAELEAAAKLAPAATADGGSNHAAPAARRLYDIGYKISPFMTFSSGPDGCIVEMKFKSLAEGQTFHDAMVKFFTTAPAASGAAGSYWMVRWPEGGDHDIDDELFADEQTARDMAELEDGAVVVELVERHSASGAVNSPAAPVSAEPVTWGVKLPGHETFGQDAVWSVRPSKELAKESFPSLEGWVHFPLYAAPQAAKGWLTKKDREWLTYLLQNVPISFDADEWIHSLLARDTPPEPASGWLTPEDRDFLDHHRRECAERASTFSNAHAVPWVRRVKLIDALLARDTPPKVPNG